MVDFPCHSREPLTLSGRCRACTKVYRRAWYAANTERVKRTSAEYRARHLEEKRAHDREAKRKLQADPVMAEVLRERKRKTRKKLRKDPARWARYLEDQRINRRLRAERTGQPMRMIGEKAYANGNGAVPLKKGKSELPAPPLAALISEWLGEFGGLQLGNYQRNDHTNGNDVTGAGYLQLAELTGVSDRRLRAIVRREQKVVRYAVADRICVALDTPIASLYPEAR